MSRKNKIPLVYRSLNMRVGILLLLAASLLFVIPALLHIGLFSGYDSAQVSLIHASGPIFRNRVSTTLSVRSTPTIGSTPMSSRTPVVAVAPLVNKTATQDIRLNLLEKEMGTIHKTSLNMGMEARVNEDAWYI